MTLGQLGHEGSSGGRLKTRKGEIRVFSHPKAVEMDSKKRSSKDRKGKKRQLTAGGRAVIVWPIVSERMWDIVFGVGPWKKGGDGEGVEGERHLTPVIELQAAW